MSNHHRRAPNPARWQLGLSQQDASYLYNLISADIQALKAQDIPRTKNVLLIRAYSVRQRLLVAMDWNEDRSNGKC